MGALARAGCGPRGQGGGLAACDHGRRGGGVGRGGGGKDVIDHSVVLLRGGRQSAYDTG